MPSKMCGKVLITLLLLATSCRVSALATAFLSDAGQHVRGGIAWLTSIRRSPLGRRQAATRPLRLKSSCLRPLSEAVSTSTRHEAEFVLTERGESKDSEGGGDGDVCKEETRVVLESYASRHSTPESAALASVREDTIRCQRAATGGAHGIWSSSRRTVEATHQTLRGKEGVGHRDVHGIQRAGFRRGLTGGWNSRHFGDERAAETARRYFTDSDHGGKIRLLLGQAMNTIDQLIAEDVWQFDVIFIDADKKRYWDYYNKVLEGPRPLLAEGGVLLADNVFFHDMVPMAEKSASEESPTTNSGIGGGKGGGIFVPTSRRLKIARSLDEFNKRVQGDDRVKVLLLPLRDGLSVIRWREGKYPNQARM